MLADRGSDAEWFCNAQEACRNTPRQMPNCLLLSHLPRSSRHVLAMCPEPKYFDDFNKDAVWDMISPPALRLHWRYPDPGTARALNVTHNTLSKKKVSRDLERESVCHAPMSIYIRI
ncbi:hypothetical protein AA0616_3088 [Komagataeibacter nataicola NRIC 0616]|nr:hypothetical protein AA0616_3088 [Komagataeibacter nataicola NRIC 0616]